jgi:transglutaminase-like putative cysteine protease
MRVDHALRLSIFLTLGIAYTCLALVVLPWLPVSTLILVGALTGIVNVVSLSQARSAVPADLKGVLAAGAVVGVASIFLGSSGLTIPAYLAVPICLALALMLPIFLWGWLPVREWAGDFCRFQSIGLVGVILSCALGDDPLIALLLPIYFACGMWSVALYHLHHQATACSTGQISTAAQPPPEGADALPWRHFGLTEIGRWALLAITIGVILLLFTPWRETSEAGEYAPGLRQAAMDLNRTGTLVLDDTVAIEVRATDRVGTAAEVQPGRYWRGATLDLYHQGRWSNPDRVRVPAADPEGQARLVDLGPRQMLLHFRVQLRPPFVPVLADPVTEPAGDRDCPALTLTDDGQRLPWTRLADGGWAPVDPPFPDHYIQATVPDGMLGVSAPVQLNAAYLYRLGEPPSSPGIAARTREILSALMAKGSLTREDLRSAPDGPLLPENHETVAQALKDHLADSGEYIYSLNLTRHNKKLDPTEDFLCNLKAGHCERYASGLTLMLRSLGIPARVVVGFHGGEAQDDGVIIIRNRFAHSWVEALIERPRPDGESELRWLRLDPTPPDRSIRGSQPFRGWRSLASREGRKAWWRNWMAESPQGQPNSTIAEGLWQRLGVEKPLDRASERIEYWNWLLVAVLVLSAVGLAWFLRRRRASAPPYPATGDFYARLIALLAQRCHLQRRPAQTPREFSAVAEQALGHRALTALAAVPGRVVSLYYRIRYGQRPLSEPERQAIEGEVGELEAALVRPHLPAVE